MTYLEVVLDNQPSPYWFTTETECLIKLIGRRTNYRLLGNYLLKKEVSVELVRSDYESADPAPPDAEHPFEVVKIVAYTPNGDRLVGYAVLAGIDQILPIGAKYAVMIYEDGVQLFYEEFEINTTDDNVVDGLRIIRDNQYRILNYV